MGALPVEDRRQKNIIFSRGSVDMKSTVNATWFEVTNGKAANRQNVCRSVPPVSRRNRPVANPETPIRCEAEQGRYSSVGVFRNIDGRFVDQKRHRLPRSTTICPVLLRKTHNVNQVSVLPVMRFEAGPRFAGILQPERFTESW
jgi:hypothetical protein